MKSFGILRVVASVFCLTVGLGFTATPSHAWQWGADDQENYEFHAEHQDEILKYGAQFGANWTAEIRDAMLAMQARAPDKAPVNQSPEALDTTD
jgi:hypothetical protein